MTEANLITSRYILDNNLLIYNKINEVIILDAILYNE